MCEAGELRSVDDVRRDSDIRPKKAKDLPVKRKALSMEEALAKTKFGLFNYVVIFLTGTIIYAVAFENFGVLYVIPVLGCDIPLTTTEKGILGSSTLFGVICASHLWGYMADTKGRRRIMMPTLFTAFCMSVCSSFVGSFHAFAALRFLSGFFLSGSSAATYAYLGEFHTTVHRSRAIMISAVLFGVSCMFAPFLAYGVINMDLVLDIPLIDMTYRPWRLFIIVGSFPGLMAAIMLLFLPESPKFLLAQGHQAAVYQILQTMNRWNNGKSAELEPFDIYEESDTMNSKQHQLEGKDSRVSLLQSIWNQTVPIFRAPHLGTTMLICSIQFCICATSNGFFVFVADVLNKIAPILDGHADQRIMMCDIINMKADNASEIVNNDDVCISKLELKTLENGAILEVVFAIGHVIVGLLINKLGKFPLTLFILLTTGLGGFGCMLTDNPQLQVYSFIALLSPGIAINIINSATIDLYPTGLRAMAMSISLMAGRMGAVVGANLVAVLMDSYCELVFYLSGSTVMLAGFLAFFIPNIHNKIASVDRIPDARISVMSFREPLSGMSQLS